jgi:CRISPR-associated protein Cas5d
MPTSSIRLHVWGDYACFTRPELKAERYSYDVMTPSAARGVLEAIHWKPAMRWVIDRIHVLKPVHRVSIRTNEFQDPAKPNIVRKQIADGGPMHLTAEHTQRSMSALADVGYLIEAHCELTPAAGPEETIAKHLDIFRRRAERGQCFRQPCLGLRQMAADFRLLKDGEPLPAAVAETRDLGPLLWDIAHGDPGKPSLFFLARLEAGVLAVPQPNSPEILR